VILTADSARPAGGCFSGSIGAVAGAHPLDNPARSALAGSHARFAQRRGNVLRYPADVAPFLALPDDPDTADWDNAAALAGPDGALLVVGTQLSLPPSWHVDWTGIQMTGEGIDAVPDNEAIVLGPADIPEMLDLVARTRPGRFLVPRSPELGTFLGIRRGNALVAMAGERLRPAGYTEISAVCTDEAWRGHGFAARLIRALAADIVARGETPFLHAANPRAIMLFEKLGFRLHRTEVSTAARVLLDNQSERTRARGEATTGQPTTSTNRFSRARGS
jgi:ribosomal protein S18 acetylase RimI-like enzyme